MTRLYDTAAWKRMAKAQLNREPVCQYCEEAPATLVDHRTPITQGGAKRERQNLASCCRQCHAEKTGCEKAGKPFVPRKHRGCDEHGKPRDPNHPWNNQPSTLREFMERDGGIDHNELCRYTDAGLSN